MFVFVQEQNRLLEYALNELTVQETHMGIVEKMPKGPLPNVRLGKD